MLTLTSKYTSEHPLSLRALMPSSISALPIPFLLCPGSTAMDITCPFLTIGPLPTSGNPTSTLHIMYPTNLPSPAGSATRKESGFVSSISSKNSSE